jgi:hypothetical protein
MKNGRIHLVYIAIIGFLAYQYWAKSEAFDNATQSIEQFDRQLRRNNEVVEKSSTMIKNEIDKQVKAYANPINLSFSEKAINIMVVSSSIEHWLDKQQLDFIKLSGGINGDQLFSLTNRLSSSASRSFFSNQKIQEIRDSLTHFQVYLDDITDKKRLEEMREKYGSSQLLKNDAYWQSLKNKTNADAMAQLTCIKNQIELDKVPYLNYTYGLVGSGGSSGFDAFRIAIAPKKAVLIEGEKFEMDAYLSHYVSNPGSDVSFWVNNEEVQPKDGVAHFVIKDKTIGKKIVKAEARIKNPLTGATTTAMGEFEYEVLPKCSRDCQ